MSAQEIPYARYIAQAKATKGGHLHIGRGGYTLHFERTRLSGYDCDHIKALCVAAGLPVIDSRTASFDAVAKLAVSGPMIAVHAEPDPGPWHAFSYAPLEVVAGAHRRIGSEVFNIEAAAFDEAADIINKFAERGRKRALDLFITALRYTGTLQRTLFANKNLTLIGWQEDPTAWSALAPQFKASKIEYADLNALTPGEFFCLSRHGVEKIRMPMAAALKAVAPKGEGSSG